MTLRSLVVFTILAILLPEETCGIGDVTLLTARPEGRALPFAHSARSDPIRQIRPPDRRLPGSLRHNRQGTSARRANF